MKIDSTAAFVSGKDIIAQSAFEKEKEFIKLVAMMLVEASFNEYENLTMERRLEIEETSNPLPSV